jgi:hypothetical protein
VFLFFAAAWLAVAAIVGWVAGYASDARERARRQREDDLPAPAIVVTNKSSTAR